MEDHLIQHSKEHFRQAHGTPFTQQLLTTLLGFDGIMAFGEQILAGHPISSDLELLAATQLLLKHQCSLLSPNECMDHPMEFEKLMQGICKWPECTMTSPSGHHLGIYKVLLKDKPPTNPPPEYIPRTHGTDMMHYVFRLMKLAVKHTFPYKHWWKVWNMFLEKEPGNPQINKLRTLHLFKADYNLLLKWYSSMGFLPQAKLHGQLHDSQGGGCPGRSAIDLACKKIALYDHIQITRSTAIDLSKDVAKCFDQMIEACMNLSCCQQGADPKYLQLHGAMQQHMRYYVKHTTGILENYNQHTDTEWCRTRCWRCMPMIDCPSKQHDLGIQINCKTMDYKNT